MPRTSCPCVELLTPVLPSAWFLGAGGTAGPRGLADASVLCLQGNPAAEEVTAQKRHPAGGRAVQRGEAEDISFWGSGCQVFPERCRPWGRGPSPVSAHGGRCRMQAGSLLRPPVLMCSWGPAVSLVPGAGRFPGFCLGGCAPWPVADAWGKGWGVCHCGNGVLGVSSAFALYSWTAAPRSRV